jgi:uncharacterized protein (DUF58 family)
MWTRKTAILVTLAVVFVLFAMMLRDYQLIIVGILFAIVIVIAHIMPRTNIEVHRFISETKAFVDDKINVRLRVMNKGFSFGVIEIYDRLPMAMRVVDGNNYMMLSLKPNEVVEFDYAIECPLRGEYTIGPIILRRRDLLSIFCERQVIENTSTLTVYPKVGETRDLAVITRYQKLNPGTTALRRIGYGTEFHSIRDYLTTDPFKRINWKVTARLRKLMVNQYELEDVYDAIIIVDAREITDIGAPLRTPLEFIIGAAMALTERFMAYGNRVGVVIYGDKIKIIAPGIGEQHKSIIFTTLARLQAIGNTKLQTVVNLAAPYFTPRSPIILLSTLDDDVTIPSAIRDLCAKNYNLNIITPSSVEFERELTIYYSPRYLMVKMERENLLDELRCYGATVIDWLPHESLSTVISAVRI